MTKSIFDGVLADHPAPWRMLATGEGSWRIDDLAGRPVFTVDAVDCAMAVVMVCSINALHDHGRFTSDAAMLAWAMDCGSPTWTSATAATRLATHVDDLKSEVAKPCGVRSWAKIRAALLGTAATAIRAANQLDLESRSVAIEKDIPF